MDEMVLRAMQKWPNVPAAYGWLALDRRGTWLLEGKPLRHARAVDFIARNYQADERGAWYFQNGPQKVYVKLAYAPLIAQVIPAAGPMLSDSLRTHTGQPIRQIRQAYMDEEGSLVLDTDQGPALVDDRDLQFLFDDLTDAHGQKLSDTALEAALCQLTQGKSADLRLCHADELIAVQAITQAEVPNRLGFVRDPEPPAESSS
jgi:uncharacterized membrane protein